jgi:hypothetical protein
MTASKLRAWLASGSTKTVCLTGSLGDRLDDGADAARYRA